MKETIAPPRDLCVVLYNDEHTPKDFIETILAQVFFKNKKEASDLIKKAESDGQALIGIYALDIAVSKRRLALYEAKKHGYPMRLEVV